MTCHVVKVGGFTSIVCTRGERPPAPCSVPGCGRTHEILCDHPLKGTRSGKTCDAKLCRAHAVNVGPDRDYCPAHARQQALDLGAGR